MGCEGVYFLLRVGEADDRTTLEINLLLEQHRLLVYAAEGTCCCRHYERPKRAVNLMDASVENLVDGARSLVTGIVDLDLEDIAGACTTVGKGVRCINRHAVNEAFIVAQLAVDIG